LHPIRRQGARTNAGTVGPNSGPEGAPQRNSVNLTESELSQKVAGDPI
jgi:hypothetical protein